MNVSELIEKLSALPAQAVVLFEGGDDLTGLATLEAESAEDDTYAVLCSS